MPSWSEVEAEAPGLAVLARGFFDARVHKTLATLRRDGSPRIALHSGSVDPPDWRGDAKLVGRAEVVTDPERIAAINGEGAPPGPTHLFRADIAELVVVHLGDPADLIIIESWHAGRGVEPHERR